MRHERRYLHPRLGHVLSGLAGSPLQEALATGWRRSVRRPGDNGESAYDPRPDIQFPHGLAVEYAGPIDVDKIADDVVARIHADPEFAARVAQQLGVHEGRASEA